MTSGYDPSSEDEFELEQSAEGLGSAAARGSIIIASVQLVKAAMMFASQVLLARVLMPTDFGLIAMVAPMISFAMILNNMGMAESIVQRPSITRQQVSAIFWATFAIGIGLALACCAVSPLIAVFYGNRNLVPLLLFTSLSIPIATMGSVPGALLARNMQFGVLQASELFSTAAGLVLTIALALYNFGYWSLPLGSLVSSGLSVAILWRACRWRPMRPRMVSSAIHDLAFGANLTAANLATFVMTTADNIIVGAVNGERALGYYDRSYRLVVQPIGQLLSPIGAVAVPLLSRLQGDAAAYRAAYFRLLRAALLLSLPPMVFCSIMANQIIEFLLGEQWMPAAPIFAWIAIGGMGSALYSSLVWLFVSQGRAGSMRNAFVIAAMLNLLAFGTGSLWGVEGVAALSAVTFVGVVTPLVSYLATRGGIVRNPDLIGCVMPYLLAVAASALALMQFRPVAGRDVFFWLPVSGVIVMGVFMAVLMLFKAERHSLSELARSIADRAVRLVRRIGRRRATGTET